LGAVYAGVKRSGSADDLAVAVELGRVLPEVPDVSAAVLGVVVGRALAEETFGEEAIFDDAGPDTVDKLGPTGRGEDVDCRDQVRLTGLDEDFAGRQREPWLVTFGVKSLARSCGRYRRSG
jgi:hypothetical protein